MNKWVNAIKEIKSNKEECICPRCNHKGLDVKYFRYNSDEIGWSIIWCPLCWYGIQITRVILPNNSNPPIRCATEEDFIFLKKITFDNYN